MVRNACNAGHPDSTSLARKLKEMGKPPQYSYLEILWIEELGRLQSIGAKRVGLN